MKTTKGRGRRLTPKHAAINLARKARTHLAATRFLGIITDITDRETTGMVTCSSPTSANDITVHVRANVDLAADDVIWIRQDPGATGLFTFDGFAKGGGTGNNAAAAPIPWTQTPGVTSPAGSSLTVQAPSGQTTIIGRAGDATQFPGTVDLSLNDLDDVNAGAPSDTQVLTWVDGSSEWQAQDAPTTSAWPAAGTCMIDTTVYATIALAIAAAGGGDLIKLGEGSFTCDNQVLPAGVDLLGSGLGVTILTTSTSVACLTAGNGCYLADLTISNTNNAGNPQAVSMAAGDSAEFRHVQASVTSTTAGIVYAFNIKESSKLIDCEGVVSAASASVAAAVNAIGSGGADFITIEGGLYSGNDADLLVDGTATILLKGPQLVNGLLSNSGTIKGFWLDAYGNVNTTAVATPILNTSGGAVAAGALGYIDEAGEFKTTTTAYLDASWGIVVLGDANNRDVYVARRGRVTVTLNGNCSAGDFLYTSTTAGRAQPQSYMRPEVFAVALTANAGGAGGTCEALLLCHTRYVNVQSSVDVISISNFSDTDFQATINGAPVGAAVVYNAPGSGAEDTINVTANNLHGKLRLYNETRGDYALIDSVNTGTNTITLTDNAPVAWANGDTITTRSQTCVAAAPPPYFYDVDLSSADNTAIPVLARVIELDVSVYDTSANGYIYHHPWETVATSKIQSVANAVASQYTVRSVSIPLIQRRFCFLSNWSGAGTGRWYARLKGYWMATP